MHIFIYLFVLSILYEYSSGKKKLLDESSTRVTRVNRHRTSSGAPLSDPAGHWHKVSTQRILKPIYNKQQRSLTAAARYLIPLRMTDYEGKAHDMKISQD